MNLTVRSGMSQRALEKVALTAKRLKTTVETAALKAPFEPDDGCVAAIGDAVICGAANVCRALETPKDDALLEWIEEALVPAVKKLEDAFSPAEITVVQQKCPVLALDDFSLLLSSMCPPSVENAKAEAARDSLEPLLRHLETQNPKGIVATCAAVEARVALKAFDKGTFPGLEKLVELANVDDALEVMPSSTMEQEPCESLTKFVERLFASAIAKAFPMLTSQSTMVMRCGNEKFGDFQCNAPMSIFKAVKGTSSCKSPRDVGAAIVAALPGNAILDKVTVAPAGFINTTVHNSVVSTHAFEIAKKAKAPTPDPDFSFGGKKKVLVDFSSPNIAKEMHVGHLRSTIIGDTLARVFEYCGHDVLRVNHVGDWGTQFGMLICQIQDNYPTFMTEPPGITELTLIYKSGKARFDAEPEFKERARRTVVALQSGDPTCRAIWDQLCVISRKEFDKVYDRLDVHLQEFGESYYNDMIPPTIDELVRLNKTVVATTASDSNGHSKKNGASLSEEEEQDVPFVEVDEQDAVFVHLPGRGYPLILRKSDGGYGYDSTDMAAIRHRIFDLGKETIIYVTDLGQAEHFHMVFQAAGIAGWVSEKHKLRHVGFGVVQGEDGKRFKTRSGDTVRLVDLLDAAVDRMRESLETRVKDGKCPLSPAEVEKAAAVIGYGAVKYFDLHQHPETNYQFSYDKMLSTSGNTAVYLLFAHARLASIIRKAKDDLGVDINLNQSLDLAVHPKERSLALEMSFFADVVETVANDCIPSRLTDFLYKLATKFTEFVTECKVLGDPRQMERLLLCHACGIVMRQAFDLLGIHHLDRI